MISSFGLSKLPFVASPVLSNTGQYHFLPGKLFHVLSKRVKACSSVKPDNKISTEGQLRALAAEPQIPNYAWQILARTR